MNFRLTGRVYLTLVVLWLGAFALILYQHNAFPRLSGRGLARNTEARLGGTSETNEVRSRDALRRLEEDLNRSLGETFPGNSLQGVAPRLPAPAAPPIVIQNKRVQDLMDRKKDWIFMTPEEVMGMASPEGQSRNSAFGPDASDNSKLSPIEQFYASLELTDNGRKPAATKKADDSSKSAVKNPWKSDNETRDDSKLPAAMRNSESSLRKLLGESSSLSVLARSMPMSSYDSSARGLSPADLKARQDYVNRFKAEILNVPSPSVGGTPGGMSDADIFGSGSASGRSGTVPGSGLSSTPTGSRAPGYDPHLGRVNPTYIPSASVDVNSKVLNGWNPQYVPSKIETPKQQPPTPNFTAPRRMF
jgi:hypothetical protein